MVFDQADVIVVHHRHPRDGPSMEDHLALLDRPVGQPHRLQGEVDLPTAIDDPCVRAWARSWRRFLSRT